MYLSERELSKEKNLLKKIFKQSCCLNVQNFSMRKIHPKRETTFWRKNRQLDHVQNSGMFCSKFIIIILFIPSFFFLKKYYLSFNIDFDINTALNTREENIWKMLKKKRRKMQTRENLWGEIIFLKKGRKKNSFCFQNSVFSVSHFPPFGCARFAHQMNLLSLESYILFLYPWLKFGMWLFQFPPHLKKIIWSFKEKKRKKLWSKKTIKK